MSVVLHARMHYAYENGMCLNVSHQYGYAFVLSDWVQFKQ